jgi:hypothetical protein
VLIAREGERVNHERLCTLTANGKSAGKSGTNQTTQVEIPNIFELVSRCRPLMLSPPQPEIILTYVRIQGVGQD